MKTRPHGTPGRRVVLTTGGMAYGAHAVARDGGRVIFVRGAAPNEEVEVSVTEERRTYAYADLLAVRRRSAVRREPPCPYLPNCGGCPWQHLEYAAQLEAKATSVAEQLRRLGGLEVPIAPIVPSPLEYGYRRRLKLRVEGHTVGFYTGGSHALVPVADCLLAEAHVRAAVPWLDDLLSALKTRVRRIEIASCGADERVVVAAEVEGQWIAADEPHCARWLQSHPRVAGLVLGGRRWRRSWGDDRVTIRPEPALALVVRAGTFTQVNRAANELLVRAVLEIVGPCAGTRVLDLYAGAGNFALPLAHRGAVVTAVEQRAQSVDDGVENAARLGLSSCRFVLGDAARTVRALADAGERVDVVILDPPRSGAAAVLPDLLRLAPARVCYVSCDLATLARDLARLARRYRIGPVRPFDLFPHTYHVETVTTATLAC